MAYFTFLPDPQLRAFVKCYWTLELSEGELPFTQHLLPYGWFEMFFHLHNRPELTTLGGDAMPGDFEMGYAGQLKQSYKLHYSKPYKGVGVSLQPWAGNMLFGIPANELKGTILDVADLDQNIHLSSRLEEASSKERMVSLLDAFFIKRFKDREVDFLSDYMVKTLYQKPGVKSHFDLEKKVGYSRRRVQQRFLESTGVTMSQFARCARFEKAADMLVQYRHQRLTDVGFDAGYYDQSHFIREFKLYAGLSPKKFVKEMAHSTATQKALMASEIN